MGGDEPKRTKEADKPDAALDFLRLLRGPGKATGDQEKTVVQRMQDLVTEYLRPNSSLDKLKPRFEAVIKDADQPISAKRRDELRRDFARLQEQLDSCLQPPPDGVSVSKAIADQDKAIKAGIAALKPDAVRTEAQQLYDKLSKEGDAAEIAKIKTRLKEIDPQLVKLLESKERFTTLTDKEQAIRKSIAGIQPEEKRTKFTDLLNSYADSRDPDERERIKESMTKISPETVKLLEERERLFAPYMKLKDQMTSLQEEFNRAAVTRQDYAQLLLAAGQKPEAQKLLAEAYRKNVDPEMSKKLWDIAIAAGVKPEDLMNSREQLATAVKQTDKMFEETEGLPGAKKSKSRIAALKLIRPDYDKALELADDEYSQATKLVGRSYDDLATEKKDIEKKYQELDDKRHKLIEGFADEDKALYKKFTQLPLGDPAADEIAKQLVAKYPEFAENIAKMQTLTVDALKVDSQMAYLEDAALSRFQISHILAEAYHKAGDDQEARKVMQAAFDGVPKELQPVLATLKGEREINSLMGEIGLTDPSLDSVQGLLGIATRRNRDGDFKGASEYWERAIKNAEALYAHPDKVRAEIEELQTNLRNGKYKDSEGERPVNAAYIKKAHERIQELLQIARAPVEARCAYAVALMERGQYADAETQWIAAKAATAKDKLPVDLMRTEADLLLKHADESKDRREKGYKLDTDLAKIVETFTAEDKLAYQKLLKLEPGSSEATKIAKDLSTRYPSFEEPFRLRQALAKDDIKNLQEDVESSMRNQAVDLQEMAKAPVKVRYTMGLFYLAGGVDQNGKPLGDQFKLAEKEPHFPTDQTGKQIASKLKGGDQSRDSDKPMPKVKELSDEELAKLSPKEREQYRLRYLVYKEVDEKVAKEEKAAEGASKTVGDKPFLAPDKAWTVINEAVNIQMESGGLGPEGQKADAELRALKALIALNAPEELQKKMEQHGGFWKNAKADTAAALTGIAVTVLLLGLTKGKALKYIEPYLGETGANVARWSGAVGFGATTSVGVRAWMMSDDPKETFADSALHGLGAYGAAGALLLTKHNLSRYYYGAFTEEKVAELAIKAMKTEGIASATELAALMRANGLAVNPELAKAAKLEAELAAAKKAQDAGAALAAEAKVPAFNEAAIRTYLAGAQGQQGAVLLRTLFPGAKLEVEGAAVSATPWSKMTTAGSNAWRAVNPLRPLAADTIPGWWSYNTRAFYQGFAAATLAQTIGTEGQALSDWRQGKLDLEKKPITPGSALAARLDFTSGKGLLNNMILQSVVMAPFLGAVSPGTPGFKGFGEAWKEGKSIAKPIDAGILAPAGYAARRMHSFINPGAAWGKVPVMQEVLRSTWLPAFWLHGVELEEALRGTIQSNLPDTTNKGLGLPETDIQKSQRYKELLGKTRKPIENKPDK